MHRHCIYTEDLMWITGKSESYARRVLKTIRLLHQKEKHQAVTIAEACAYLGLPYQDVFNTLNRIKPDISNTNTNSQAT